MKRLGTGLMMVGVLVMALAMVGQAAAQGDQPQPEAEAVWNYLTEANYQGWGTWPAAEFEGYLRSGDPHSQVVKIYANDVALGVANNFPGEMPEGSIIVKDNFMGSSVDSPGDLGAVTVMYKQAGYNPDGGDWFWAKYQPDGSVDAAGKPAGCIGCHLGIEGHKDGVLRWGFGGEPAVASAAESEAVQQVMTQAQQPEKMPTTGGTPYQTGLFLAFATGLVLIFAGYALRRYETASR